MFLGRSRALKPSCRHFVSKESWNEETLINIFTVSGSARRFVQLFLFFYVTLAVCIRDHLVHFWFNIWFINVTFMASIQIPEKTASCRRKTLIIILLFKSVCILLVYEWYLASSYWLLSTVPSRLRQYSTAIKGLRLWN